MKNLILSGLMLGLAGRSLPALASEPSAAIPPRIPIENFARPEIISDLALSRDGKTIAYETGFNKEWILILRDWDTGKASSTGVDASNQTPLWINRERVMYGLDMAMDRDGGRQKSAMVSANQVIFSRFAGARQDYVLAKVYDRRVDGFYIPYYYLHFPHVHQLDTRADVNGMARIEQNPGNVTDWLVDGNGMIRVAVQVSGALNRIVTRADDNSAWRPLPGLDWADDKFRALALGKDGQTLYLSHATPGGTKGIYAYDVKNGRMGSLILSHDQYDLEADDCLILSPATRELLGVKYVSDKPTTVWLDEGLRTVQAALDQVLPGKVNLVTAMSDDLQRLIILSQSDRDPGTYYQFDRKKVELKPLIRRRPGLKAEELACTLPISFKARDGLLIHGYLTTPTGRDPKHLPLIVFPHDGPAERNNGMYSSYVQFFANRGYAVLQVNYRGSAGYGMKFKDRARQRIGREPQDDITDGTRWAVGNGLADPKRIGIFGEGTYSGYSAAIGLMRNPDLYCCAVSIDGASDWAKRLRFVKLISEGSYDRFTAWFGDPIQSSIEMKDISPIAHVKELKGALFLAYNEVDNGSSGEANDLTTALKKEGKIFEVLNRKNGLYSINELKARAELFTRIEQFLAKYMPADSVLAAATAK